MVTGNVAELESVPIAVINARFIGEKTIQSIAEQYTVGLREIAQPLRSALCGSMSAPGIFDVMNVLGREETLGRVEDVLELKKA